MSEKSKVKSFIRKGKIVKSFDRKKKTGQRNIVLGSIAALGVVGVGGKLLLKKGLRAPQNQAVRGTIISSNTNVSNAATSVVQPQTIVAKEMIARPKILKRKTQAKEFPVLYEGTAKLNRALYFPTGKAKPLPNDPTKAQVRRRLKDEAERIEKNNIELRNMKPPKSRVKRITKK